MTAKPELNSELGDGSATDPEGLVHVTGYIIDHAKRAVPGATVVVRNSNKRTTADADGEFKMYVPASAVLVINSVGFQSAEMVIPAMKDYTVIYRLKPKTGGGTAAPVTNVPGGVSKAISALEKQPTFPGGEKAMQAFIALNLRYPASATQANIEGKVLVTFLVDADGSINRVSLIKGIGFGCNEEAIRIVEAMPKWTPARQNSRSVTASYNLQVDFQLANKTTPKKKTSSGWLVGYSPLDSVVKKQP